MKHDCNAVDERIRTLEAELAETRLQVDCGKEPCSWVGGACVHHYRRYYESARAEVERLKAGFVPPEDRILLAMLKERLNAVRKEG